MILIEKDAQKAQDQSMSPSSEKDFKELIDEIDKVRNQNSSNSETDEKSKENSSNSPKSQNEEGKSSTKNIEVIPKEIDEKKKNNLNEINQANGPNLKFLNENQNKSKPMMDLNIINGINSINNYVNNKVQLNNFELNKNDLNSNNVNSMNNQNNFRTDVYNNTYYYPRDNNNINMFGQNSLNTYYSNNDKNNSELNINKNFDSSDKYCFNNDVNNNLLISFLKNQILNDLKKQQIQENTYRNINIICNYVNNFNNNNYNILLQNEIQKQLLNQEKNYNNDIYKKLLLLNNINNNLNSINNNTNQNDINCFNINNNINNLIQLNNGEINSNLNQLNLNDDLFNVNKNNINNINNIFQSTHSNKKKTTAQTRKKYKNKAPIDISKNQINLMNIFLCEDNRTTLMIKNIPNKYTISSFLDEINIYFKHTYDVFYLPIDYVNKCNLGFAFINFVEPLHIILFYELYRGKKWKKFKSDKICELLYAKFQNKKELISHFEKGKVLFYDSAEKRPLILPTPKILPKINIPYYYLNLFTKLYPKVSYEIKEFKYYKDKKNNNEICIDNNQINNKEIFLVFSIDGNFMQKNK